MQGSLKSWASKFSRGNRRRKLARTRRKASRFAGVEQLEGRHMMAVVASFANDQLSIIGDSAADTVVVSTVDVGGVAQVTVNGQSVGAGVNASAVTSIFANLGGGNDSMNLSTLNLTKFIGLTAGSIEIRGGAGNDTLVGSPLGDILKGEDGNDSLTGGAGNDQLIGGNGNDTLVGGAGDDILDGGLNDDVFSFSGSTDLGSDTVIQAASGNLDTLGFGSLGGAIVVDISMTTPQVVRSGQLTLTLSDAAGIDNVQGTAYDDVILGNAGGNSLMGNGGNDYLWGRGGNDWLDGGAGNDTLYGGDGNDTLLGKGGNDSLYGHAGADTLNGNEGNDYLSGDDGDDAYIVTNYGTKTIGASAASDNDWLDLAGNAPAAALDLSSTSAQAVAASLWVRFTEADAVSWVPGAGDNGTHAGGLYQAGYYTIPGVEGTTTTLAFTYGGAVAAYHNPVYVYNADTLQPGQEPSGEYLFTGNETAKGTVVPRSYPAGTTLGFYILQDGVDGFNGGARTRFYSENARNTKDENAEQRQHVRAYDLSPTVLQLSWEDLFYVLPNPGGYRDTDFNDLWMSVEATNYTAVDLDADSDNIDVDANGDDLDRSGYEDAIENDSSLPGKILGVGGERAKLIAKVANGYQGTLAISAGIDKVRLYAAAEGGAPVSLTVFDQSGRPAIALADYSPSSITSTSKVWTFWIDAYSPSDQLADISFGLEGTSASSGAEIAYDDTRSTAEKVDLSIWHGQTDLTPDLLGNRPPALGDGKGVEMEEYDPDLKVGGAFTVANLNDTDADGISDSNDTLISNLRTVVTAVSGDNTTIFVDQIDGYRVGDHVVVGLSQDREITGVDAANKSLTLKSALVGNVVGGDVFLLSLASDDVDLMPMEIVLTSFVEGADVVLDVTPNARLYESRSKADPIVAVDGKVQISASSMEGGKKLIWVEVIGVSQSVGDVVIKATYRGATDKVNATRIWVTEVQVLHDNADVLWPNLASNVDLAPASVGLLNDVQSEVRNAIAFKFVVSPAGVENQPNVAFDGGRRIQRVAWQLLPGQDPLVRASWIHDVATPPAVFPVLRDASNDDALGDKDESDKVEDRHFSSTDKPGLARPPNGPEGGLHEMNAEEFLRVAFGLQNGATETARPTGNGVRGSRVSAFVPWYSRARFNSIANGFPTRVDDDNIFDNESHPDNCIGEGQRELTGP